VWLSAREVVPPFVEVYSGGMVVSPGFRQIAPFSSDVSGPTACAEAQVAPFLGRYVVEDMSVTGSHLSAIVWAVRSASANIVSVGFT
jgi:hypothetical protein